MLRKHFKKLVSVVMATAMIIGGSVNAFAAESPRFVDSNNIEYITIYNEENNTVQAVQKNHTTGECIYGPVISVNSNAENPEHDTNAARANKIHQDTFLNFEYDIWESNPREWNLERPNGVFDQYYFKCYENSSNSSELSDWKDDVDALNAQEFVVIGAVGVSAYEIIKAAIISHAAIASGGILTAEAIDSIKDAVVSTGATGVAIGLLCTCYNNCAMAYQDVFNATDNKHY